MHDTRSHKSVRMTVRISHCYGELFQFSFDFLIGSNTELSARAY